MTKTFVLVHGAWQAPYAWQAVKVKLESQGQKVVVVELPGHGSDESPAAKASIDSYADKVVSVLNAESGKVILVGHSMGGMVVSSVAERIPMKVEKLVFVGAYVPSSGQSLMDLSMKDKQSHLPAVLVPSQDQLTLGIKTENLTDVFCQDGTDSEKELIIKNYRPEPAIPFTNKVTVTPENFGKVNKAYIRTTQDHAVGIDLQDVMIKAANITETYSVQTGHCPFISRPDEIAQLLLKM